MGQVPQWDPRIAGKILAWLLVCERWEQEAAPSRRLTSRRVAEMMAFDSWWERERPAAASRA